MLMFRLVKVYSFLLDHPGSWNNNKNSKMKHRTFAFRWSSRKSMTSRLLIHCLLIHSGSNLPHKHHLKLIPQAISAVLSQCWETLLVLEKFTNAWLLPYLRCDLLLHAWPHVHANRSSCCKLVQDSLPVLVHQLGKQRQGRMTSP